jgi:hypothetical protein
MTTMRSRRPPTSPDVDTLLSAVRARYERFGPSSSVRAEFVAHLQSLARRHEEPMDYPQDDGPAFPAVLPVAYAVCHPECGARDFIVEGSTQECSYCGGSLFRLKKAEYRLVSREAPARREKRRQKPAARRARR